MKYEHLDTDCSCLLTGTYGNDVEGIWNLFKPKVLDTVDKHITKIKDLSRIMKNGISL